MLRGLIGQGEFGNRERLDILRAKDGRYGRGMVRFALDAQSRAQGEPRDFELQFPEDRPLSLHRRSRIAVFERKSFLRGNVTCDDPVPFATSRMGIKCS